MTQTTLLLLMAFAAVVMVQPKKMMGKWFGNTSGKWYHVSVRKATYADAIEKCKELDSKLFEPRTEWEYKNIKTHMDNHYWCYKCSFWAGAQGSSWNKKDYAWASDNTKVLTEKAKTYIQWDDALPNPERYRGSSCLLMVHGQFDTQLRLANADCQIRKNYVCEYKGAD